MSHVFVLNSERKPMPPCQRGRARKLLDNGKAAVLRLYPFTIILQDCKEEVVPDRFRVKIDPGSQTTGIVVLNDKTGNVVWAAEISHHGFSIRENMEKRRALRRGRRYRKVRYRQPRFNNRTRPKGWLPPSLVSRVENTMTWVRRLLAICPIYAISFENVQFDTQKMQNPEIEGEGYQQGELHGYEIREYLLEKWGRKCAYCGVGIAAKDPKKKKSVPLEVEHIIPKSRGGSNRVSNLTIACRKCNVKKGAQTAKEFGHPDIQRKAKLPLRDAAAVNSTRWAIFNRLVEFGLPVESGTGGRTKYNRTRMKFPKEHWIDAACVGASTPEKIVVKGVSPLYIKSMGHGKRRMCMPDKYGFPRGHRKRSKSFQGFRTGDVVRADIPKGKRKGRWTGRVTIRQTPRFAISTKQGKMDGIHPKYMTTLFHGDGYEYSYKAPKKKTKGASA